jgi:predicted porin
MMKLIGTAAIRNATLLAGVLASSSAFAQSNVDVYGIIDVLLGPTTNLTKDKGTTWRVSSSGMNVSRLGFRGSEDLGGGLKAVYQLEMGLIPDTGNTDNPLFKRQANVGLEGSFGRLVLGRSFTSVYDFMLPYDPMGYAPFYSWVPTGNASGVSKYGMTTAFDNLIKYTGKFDNLSVGLTYGAGEQSATIGDSAKGAVAVNYAIGPVSVVGTYERRARRNHRLARGRDVHQRQAETAERCTRLPAAGRETADAGCARPPVLAGRQLPADVAGDGDRRRVLPGRA